ncbi:hypothetical protein [Leptolyngbya sp. AN10]
MSSTLNTQFSLCTRAVLDTISGPDYSPHFVERRKSGWTPFLEEGRDYIIDASNCYWSIDGAHRLRNVLLYFHRTKCKANEDLTYQSQKIQQGYKLTESSLESPEITSHERDYVLWHWFMEQVHRPDELILRSWRIQPEQPDLWERAYVKACAILLQAGEQPAWIACGLQASLEQALLTPKVQKLQTDIEQLRQIEQGLHDQISVLQSQLLHAQQQFELIHHQLADSNTRRKRLIQSYSQFINLTLPWLPLVFWGSCAISMLVLLLGFQVSQQILLKSYP